MKELARKYRESMKVLKIRIEELTFEVDKLILSGHDPEFSSDVIDLKDRLRTLNNMYNDLREVAREVEHYYDRWWWRSGKYTCNQNKPAPVKCDEEFLRYGYSITSDRKTKKSFRNVLCRRKNNGRNSRNIRD